MERIVLTIGGLFSSFGWGDLFFFVVTLLLLLLLVYIVYLIKVDDDEEEGDLSQMLSVADDKISLPKPSVNQKPLSKIVDELETDYNPKPIDLSEYEKEMEDTAIISYDELVQRASTATNIYYDDNYESGFDDIVVQKVDNKESKTQELVNLPKAIMMSYENEEAFLSALKVLQKNLVR